MYRGISSNEYDKHVQRFDHRSTLSKLNIQFWEAKQTFLQKIVKREDDCIIAYDAELDAKLELFKSIAETCQRLLCVIEGYQDRICILAHEESCIGRFLKECGRVNKDLLGKMLTATGKTLYYSAQQRIQLRNPLISIFQNLETFQMKAIADTLITIEQMEKQRTAYRASLLWMKSLSTKLDPDSYPELEKFRKIQNHVRKTKQKYDKKKIDCIQKVDMLNASRCNMLGQTLANYQAAWMTFWSNTAYTIATISNCFEGCQLNEMAEILNVEDRDPDKRSETKHKDKPVDQEDLLLLGEEVQEQNADEQNPNQSQPQNLETNDQTRRQKEDQLGKQIDLIDIDDSLDLFADDSLMMVSQNASAPKNAQELQARKKHVDDLLTSSVDSEDLILLNDILNISSNEKSFFHSNNDLMMGPINQLSSFGKENNQPTTIGKMTVPNSQIKLEKEKKKWTELFADLDVFNNSKNKKKSQGDC